MDKGQPLACFDFDGTMIRGDSIVAYLRFACRQGKASPGRLAAAAGHTALYFLHGESGEEVKTHALSFLAHLSPKDRAALDEAFVRQDLLPRIYPDALKRWREHRQAGNKMLLVSASTDNYMRCVAAYLQADALLCTRLLPDGRVADNCKGEEKVARWRQANAGNEFEVCRAYGDSPSDLPMLRLAAEPVWVNAGRRTRELLPGARVLRTR